VQAHRLLEELRRRLRRRHAACSRSLGEHPAPRVKFHRKAPEIHRHAGAIIGGFARRYGARS
jgi:hypothetical protein